MGLIRLSTFSLCAALVTFGLLLPPATSAVPQVFLPMAPTPNPQAVAECSKFRQDLLNDGIAESGYLIAPSDYFPPSGSMPVTSLKVFYWIRRGTDSSKPPLLLIQGGPGGNSWRYYATFKAANDAGDIVSIDNRNEGCSHVMAYDLNPHAYRIFRSRQVVEDLERLRKLLALSARREMARLRSTKSQLELTAKHFTLFA